MTTKTTTLPAQRTATAEGKPTSIMAGDSGLKMTTLNDMMRFAQYVVSSGLAPKGMTKPETVLIAMQSGMEIGFMPMQALQNVTVINGRANIYGDAGLALVRSKDLLEDMTEKREGTIAAGNRKITITMKRKGQTAIERSFSIEDAKRAGLWDKTNSDGSPSTWKKYPERMLYYRPLSFCLRDLFSDVLKGVAIAEEDYTPQKEKNITADVEVSDPRALALTEEQPSTEPVAANNNENSTTSENLTSPPAQVVFVRDAIVTELTAIIDIAKPKKIAKAMDDAKISAWDEGKSWTEIHPTLTELELKTLLSFLKC